MFARRRMLFGIAGTILVLLIVGVGAAYYLVTKSFPKTSGTEKVQGLQAAVQIYRDSYGVPHIFAASDHDGYYAIGYVHAQERLFQMELIRRAGMGRLSEILGEAALPADEMLRTLGLWRTAKKNAESLDPLVRSALQAYADGVNAFIESHRGSLPIEFDMLRFEPEPWTVGQSLVVSRLMAWELNFSRWTDILMGVLTQKFGEERAREVFPNWPSGAPFILPKEGKQKSTSVLPTQLMQADLSYRKLMGINDVSSGSNAWVISGTKTKSGKPIVANDPHLVLMAPARWFELHLHTPDVDVAGPTIAGVPFVVIGRNERIAWGVTNAMMDDADYYVEEVDSVQHPTKFMFDNEWQPIKQYIDTIFVKDSLPVVYTSYWTQHGPIVNRIEPDAQFSPQLISMRWTGNDPSDEARTFYLINRAANWTDFKEALKSFGSPAQNFVYGDVDGHIGYITGGKLPIRTVKSAMVPFSGNTSQFEWKGYVPLDKMPQSFDPPEGYIATANNKIIDDSYPYYIASNWEPPWRAERINEVLKNQDKFSVEDMQHLQLDLVSVQARQLVPVILKAFDSVDVRNEDVKMALTYFRTWNFEMTKNDVATTLFEDFFLKTIHNTFDDEFGSQLIGLYDTLASVPMTVMTELLEKDSSAWFDNIATPEVETKNDIIRKSLEDAVNDLKGLLGGELKEWQWGRLHKIEFRHIFSANKLLGPIFDIGPFAVGGSHATIWKGDFSLSHPFANTVGPSTRQVFDLSDMNNTRAVTPPGESGQVFSAHYSDQVQLWLLGEYRRMPMQRDVIEQTCRDVLTLEPE
jgi:penicillin G amidase